MTIEELQKQSDLLQEYKRSERTISMIAGEDSSEFEVEIGGCDIYIPLEVKEALKAHLISHHNKIKEQIAAL